MADQRTFFTDGAAYDRMMGRWSALAGAEFLDWLALPKGLRWLDVGCGTGAFTELLIARCAPAEVQGIDPAAAQIDYASEPARGATCAVPPGRCAGAAVCRRQFRCRGHGVGDRLRSRPGEGIGGNGSGGAAGRLDGCLYVGPSGWRITERTDHLGDAIHGRDLCDAAERRVFAAGQYARAVEQAGTCGDRHASDQVPSAMPISKSSGS